MQKTGLLIGVAIILVAAAVFVLQGKQTGSLREITVPTEETDENISPAGAEKLAGRETAGGLCPDDRICGDKIAIYRDGKVVKTGTGESREVEEGRVVKLAELITTKNVEELKRKKFTGLCPTAYDGVEVTYVFVVNGKEERVGSCEYELPKNNSLIEEVAGVLETAGW